MIEPKFMPHEVSWSIPQSQRTVYVPARMVNGEPKALTKAEFDRILPTPADIDRSARQAASLVCKTLKPEYVRDERKIIQYAVITSENSLTATAVLAPEFPELFAKTLGPDLLVAIPNRNKIYVFPKLSPSYQVLTEAVIADYESSSHPVSRELFEYENGRLQALGIYR